MNEAMMNQQQPAANAEARGQNMRDVQIIDLGPNNDGAFGPRALYANDPERLAAEVAPNKYRRRFSGVWRCVDGRGRADGAVEDPEVADAQTPGSLPFTNTAGDLMDSRRSGPRVSECVARNTREAVEGGKKVKVHGDDHGHRQNKSGCAANRDMRLAFRHIGANADIIAPSVWMLVQAKGLDQHVTQDDVADAITTAGRIAEDDSVWDVTAEQAIDIALENGAEYEELTGPHMEQGAAVELDDDTAFAARQFAADHQHEDGEDQLFVETIGIYVKTIMEDGKKVGIPPRESALKAMRGLVYCIGLPKKIVTKYLRVFAMQ